MSLVSYGDKKWRESQSSRLRNRNFHAKRKVLLASDGGTNAKKEKNSEESVSEPLVVESSNSSSSFHDSSAGDSELPENVDTRGNTYCDSAEAAEHTSSPRAKDMGQVHAADETNGQPNPGIDDGSKIASAIKQYAKDYKLRYNHLDGLLQTLHDFYPSLPLSSRTLMGPRTKILIEDFPSNREDSKAEFAYFGIANSLLRIVNPLFHLNRKLRLKFFFDGLTLYNSSKIELWPILGQIYTEDNVYSPFVVAIYCGVGKPKCVHQYLWKFILELNHLLSNGIRIENEDFCVELMALVADTLARAYVKCCQGHAGFHACERCDIVGFKVDGTTVFPIFEAMLRTDASFRAQDDPLHHTGISPLLLIKPAIDMIKRFILDFMHLVCLGVMKKLITEYWMVLSLKILSRENLGRLCLRLTNLSNQIPSDFQRSTRSLSDVSQWKATEFRFFVLYIGMLILKDILPEDFYKNFMLLSVGCRILCSKIFYKIYLQPAREYLKTFVKTSVNPNLYGPKFLVINDHNVSHLADDVEYLDCPAMDYSAFLFESFLGRLKDLVESGNKPLAQICNKIQDYFEDEKPMKKPDFEVRRVIKIKDGQFRFKKVRFHECELSLDGVNDVVSLKNGEIVRIASMTSSSKDSRPSQILIKGSRVNVIGPAFTYPCDSSILKIHQVREDESQSIETTLESVEHKWILLKIFEVPGDAIDSYAMPLLHMN